MRLRITLTEPGGLVIGEIELPSSIYLTYTDEELLELIEEFMEHNGIRRSNG